MFMITLGNVSMNQIRWRFIISALLATLLGAVLVFTGQFFAESSRSTSGVVFVSSDIQPPFSGDAPYEWAYSATGRSLGTPYHNVNGAPEYPGLPRGVFTSVTPPASQKSQWQTLWYQLSFLDWLQSQKGQQAGYVAAFTALLVAWAVYAVDRWRQRSKVHT
jgi:hypothetical protein